MSDEEETESLTEAQRRVARERRTKRRAARAADESVGPVELPSSPPPKPGDDPEFERRLATLPRNDIGNAERFIARCGLDFLWVRDAGWYAWDGKRWDYAGGEVKARLAAQSVAEAIVHEARAIESDGPLDGETDRETDERIAAAFRWAVQSGNASRLSAMLDIAAPRLARRQDELDANAFLFNVANGTLVLGDLGDEGDIEVVLRAHRREDRITRVSPVAYDPAATKRPHFQGFLDLVLPARPVQAFLQRSFGYSATGSIEEQVIFLLHGEGNNGKSTLVDLMAWLFGDYSMSVPVKSLLENDRRGGSEASPDLARLPGARFVRTGEPPAGSALGESLVKQITGGEEMPVRHLNKGFFDFRPTFKLMMSFNRKPRVKGDDDGIWRRLPLVNFDVQIPADRVDKTFLDRKLKPEGPAILNWVVDGYRLWRETGLALPSEVSDATKEYRAESDSIGNFLADACEVTGEPANWIGGKILYHCYALWCRESAIEPVSNTFFGRRLTAPSLKARGLKKSRSGTVTYFGVRIKDPALEERARHAANREPAPQGNRGGGAS